MDKAEIGVKVGKVVNRYKMAKHFRLAIEDGSFSWKRDEESIAREAALDGVYVIRTSESEENLSAADTVRTYKSLAQVERLFRTLKGIDLRIRPIRHRTEDHVRAHILLCTLAYYIEWHMRRALAPLLFNDEELGFHGSLAYTRTYLDEMDNHVATLYTARPTRIYFIDREGRVAYNPGIGPFGFNPDHLEPVMQEHLARIGEP